MTIRPILTVPDFRLYTQSRPVGPITLNIHQLVHDMFETMEANNGCGLAAIQIGVPFRVIVMDVGEQKYTFIDPEIAGLSKKTESKGEMCLSVPGTVKTIERPSICGINYRTLRGETLTDQKFKGELARVIQHEIDHLNGITLENREEGPNDYLCFSR